MLNHIYKSCLKGQGYIKVIDHMGTDESICIGARTSTGSEKKGYDADQKLLNYLMRNGHTSPFEMPTLIIEVKAPIYIARQWNRHRTGVGFDRYSSVQEKSLRYVESDTEYYIPGDKSEEYWGVAEAYLDELTDFYSSSLVNEVSKEHARTILPVSTFTIFQWKIDAKNLMDFLMQRNHKHAQPEIIEYAKALEEILAEWLPQTYKVFKRARLMRRFSEVLFKDESLSLLFNCDNKLMSELANLYYDEYNKYAF